MTWVIIVALMAALPAAYRYGFGHGVVAEQKAMLRHLAEFEDLAVERGDAEATAREQAAKALNDRMRAEQNQEDLARRLQAAHDELRKAREAGYRWENG